MTAGFMFSASSAPPKEVSPSQAIPSKIRLSLEEERDILKGLAWRIRPAHEMFPLIIHNDMLSIADRAETFFIPKKIIQRLEEIARLHNDGARSRSAEGRTDRQIKAVLRDAGVLKLLPKYEVSGYIRRIKREGLSFFEKWRSEAIEALGRIGKQQPLPQTTARFLKNLLFEVENPDTRIHVVSAFGNLMKFHPPDLFFLSRLAERMAVWRNPQNETGILAEPYQVFLEEELNHPPGGAYSEPVKIKTEGIPAKGAVKRADPVWPSSRLSIIWTYDLLFSALKEAAKNSPLPHRLIEEIIETPAGLAPVKRRRLLKFILTGLEDPPEKTALRIRALLSGGDSGGNLLKAKVSPSCHESLRARNL